MIVDKDTGKVYDLRNEMHLDRLIEKNNQRDGTFHQSSKIANTAVTLPTESNKN